MNLEGLIREVFDARSRASVEESRLQEMTLRVEDALRTELAPTGLPEGLLARLSFDDLLELHSAFFGRQWMLSAEDVVLLERAVSQSPLFDDRFRDQLAGVLVVVRSRAGLEPLIAQETQVFHPEPSHRGDTLRYS